MDASAGHHRHESSLNGVGVECGEQDGGEGMRMAGDLSHGDEEEKRTTLM